MSCRTSGVGTILRIFVSASWKACCSTTPLSGGSRHESGQSGSIVATPIINQPQSAILGVGMIEKRVKVINDAIAIRPCAYLSLTFDHRVADGATADAFLMRVKQILETWA